MILASLNFAMNKMLKRFQKAKNRTPKLPIAFMGIKPFTAIFLTICCLATPLSAHQGATGIVKERMDQFSNSRHQMKQMRAALQNNQFDVIAEISADMQIWAKKIVTAFPEGSQIAPTEAADSVWTDKQGFAAAASFYETSLIQLNQAAATFDRDAVASAYQQVGQSCKSCHRTYRHR